MENHGIQLTFSIFTKPFVRPVAGTCARSRGPSCLRRHPSCRCSLVTNRLTYRYQLAFFSSLSSVKKCKLIWISLSQAPTAYMCCTTYKLFLSACGSSKLQTWTPTDSQNVYFTRFWGRRPEPPTRGAWTTRRPHRRPPKPPKGRLLLYEHTACGWSLQHAIILVNEGSGCRAELSTSMHLLDDTAARGSEFLVWVSQTKDPVLRMPSRSLYGWMRPASLMGYRFGCISAALTTVKHRIAKYNSWVNLIR